MAALKAGLEDEALAARDHRLRAGLDPLLALPHALDEDARSRDGLSIWATVRPAQPGFSTRRARISQAW